MKNKIGPFENSHFIGYVKQVTPEYVMVHIPSSKLLSLYHFSGEKHHPGIVGSYLAIEGEEFGFLGRILELNLSEKERLGLTEKSFENEDFHPIAKVEILMSFNYFDSSQVDKGLDTFPHVGAKVFSCTAAFLQKYLLNFGNEIKSEASAVINFATLTADHSITVNVSPQSLFARHCVIVGTTGGGKSWTVSKLIEEVLENNGKTILLDATGEYHPFDNNPKTVSATIGNDCYLHYTNLGLSDLFYLLRPSDKVQRPKLMEAIKSLKIVRISNGSSATEKIEMTIDEKGHLKKEGGVIKNYERFFYKNINKIDEDNVNFNIKNLSRQITLECIFSTDRNESTKYGGRSEVDVSNCVSLISRIDNIINSGFNDIFGFNNVSSDGKDLIQVVEAFLANPEKRLLRISLDKVGFEYQAREILANTIGRYLLKKARSGVFKTNGSVILFVDEAHQFLNKTVQDEYSPVQPLDAFDLIAKESRKFGLFLCLATQMPRDIPIGTLSQMGTFIAHRLINRYDKDAVENACSVANRAVLSFLPALGKGEAILLGVDFPMPISIKITEPKIKPDSTTPPVII